MTARSREAVLTERRDQGTLHGNIRVFQTNSGGYIAEYKLGTVKWPVPVSGRTAIEALENAKKWLSTSIGSR